MDGFRQTNDWLQVRAALSPDSPALIFQGQTWTFEQLNDLVNRLANYMINLGVRPNEHAGLLMPNSLAAVCCVFAIARLSAVLIPLNTRLTPEELAWQIDRADCAHVLCEAGMMDTVRRAVGDHISVHSLPHKAETLEESLSAETALFNKRIEGDLNSLQAIVFTSGTTGIPKGAMITYANHYWSALGSAMRLGTMPDDRWLACLPLYHVGGLAILFRSCLNGTAVALHDGFDGRAVMDSLRGEAITIVSLVPTMMGRLLRAGLNAFLAPSLRLILLGGAAAPPDMLAEAAAAGLPVAVTYGLTEATSQVATLMPDGTRVKPGSAGTPIDFTSIAIVDNAGNDLPPNTPGEIVVAGRTIMAGYYADPAATVERVKDGRLFTGDIGYLDEDGDLWILDRRSDLIVSGGENVYPAEVERVLREHPAVAQACVVGTPDQEWGHAVAALIVPQEPGAVSEDELIAYSRERLAGYKQPRIVRIVDWLPLTGPGKVNRRAAAEELARVVTTP